MRAKWALPARSTLQKGPVFDLYKMRALDNEINHFNYRRPDGSMIPLEQASPFFARDLKIPDPEKRSGKLLWPPPQPNLGLQYLASMPPDRFIISEAAKGCYTEESRRRMLEDNQRVAEAARSAKPPKPALPIF